MKMYEATNHEIILFITCLASIALHMFLSMLRCPMFDPI